MSFLDSMKTAVPLEAVDAFIAKQRKGKKPFNKTYSWIRAAGLNQRKCGPLLTGRGNLAAVEGERADNIEPVIRFGGKRKLVKGK